MDLAHRVRLLQKATNSQVLLVTPIPSATWGCQREANRPVRDVDSIVQRRFRNSGVFCPLSQCSSVSGVDDAEVSSRVPPLLLACRPATVLRRVRSVVVYPPQCGVSRSWTHVLGELCEAIPPCWANGNPTTSIPPVARACRIQAARLHRGPDVIEGGSRRSVCSSRRLHRLCVQTSTALGLPLPQGVRTCGHLSSAVTPTAPAGFSEAVILCPLQYDQTCKALSREEDRRNHPLSIA